jgi:hypothetical protein
MLHDFKARMHLECNDGKTETDVKDADATEPSQSRDGPPAFTTNKEGNDHDEKGNSCKSKSKPVVSDLLVDCVTRYIVRSLTLSFFPRTEVVKP